MREQVCLYTVPVRRFQSVMFDPTPVLCPYDPNRGDLAAAAGKSQTR